MATMGIKISATITVAGVTDPQVYGFGLHFVRRGTSVGSNSSPNINWGDIESEFSVELQKPATPPPPPNPEDPTSWTQTGNTFALTFPGTEGGETGDFVALQPGTYMLAAVRIDFIEPVYLYAGMDFNADSLTVTMPKFYTNPAVHLPAITLTQHSWAIP